MKRSEVQQGQKVRLNFDSSMRGIIIATESRQGADFVVVEWDRNQFVDHNEIEELSVVPESDGTLEREFETLIDTVGKQIEEHINAAHKSLLAATELADAHGIPFFTHVSELGQSYVPYSFRKKWVDLDPNYVVDLTEIDKEELSEAGGWQSSSIC
jgi:hypothetical protein